MPATRRTTAGKFLNRTASNKTCSVSTKTFAVSACGSVGLLSFTNEPSFWP